MTSILGLLFTTSAYKWGLVPSREHSTYLHSAVDIQDNSCDVRYFTGRLMVDDSSKPIIVDRKSYIATLTRKYNLYLGMKVGFDGLMCGTQDKHDYDTIDGKIKLSNGIFDTNLSDKI